MEFIILLTDCLYFGKIKIEKINIWIIQYIKQHYYTLKYYNIKYIYMNKYDIIDAITLKKYNKIKHLSFIKTFGHPTKCLSCSELFTYDELRK